MRGCDGAGCRAEVGRAALRFFQEKVSGAKSDRKQLARLIGRLGHDDVLVVARLDRLAESAIRPTADRGQTNLFCARL